ncbi:hypothetical protein ACXR0O_06465 [Verrucomicrobiota bacterium sgz303538]
MKTVVRAVAFAAVAFAVNATEAWWFTRIEPEYSSTHTLRELDAHSVNIPALRRAEAEMGLIHTGATITILSAAALLFAAPVRRAWERNRRRWTIMIPALIAMLSAECVRPYLQADLFCRLPIIH